MTETVKNVFTLIRIKDWVKNSFVFLPAFFAGRIDLIASVPLIILFFCFCFAASSIYIINDILDAESDRLHPSKSKRPLASGMLSTKTAIAISGVMLLLFLATLTQTHAWKFIIGYFILNLAYSFKLKHISILDVSCISVGFVLRVLAGGNEAGVYVSYWMIIVVFLLSISMAFAKRRDDLLIEGDKQTLRKSLGGYTIQFLDIAKTITFTITLISYILYSISPEVMSRVGTDKIYITSFFVFLGIMRYLQITIVDNNSGSPVEVLWKDRFLQLTMFCWILTFAILLYGSHL